MRRDDGCGMGRDVRYVCVCDDPGDDDVNDGTMGMVGTGDDGMGDGMGW